MTTDFYFTTVGDLITDGIIEKPLDGNHGELHPKGNDFVQSGIPFIMASDIENGQINFSSCKYITEKQARKLRKGFAKTEDVLITHKATIGRTAVVGKLSTPYIILTPQITYYRVIDKTKLDNHYLKYYFDSEEFQKLFSQWAGGGSTRDYLGITEQQHLPIILLPLEEQKRIAGILSSFDDKIELNRKMCKTFEAMAQALFQSWFVDFEPVKAKIAAVEAGRDPELAAMMSISGKTESGIAEMKSVQPKAYAELARTASLFPSSIIDTEQGPIPNGWKWKSLDEIAKFLNGVAMQKYPVSAVDGNYLPVIKIAQLNQGSTENADRASLQVPPEYIIHDGDVLFSWSGSLNVDLWSGGKGALNQHLFKVTSTSYPKYFYYFWCKQHLNDFRAIAATKAVTMGHIQRKHLSLAKVTIPSKELIEYDFFIKQLDRIMAAKLQIVVLSKQKNYLLNYFFRDYHE